MTAQVLTCFVQWWPEAHVAPLDAGAAESGGGQVDAQPPGAGRAQAAPRVDT